MRLDTSRSVRMLSCVRPMLLLLLTLLVMSCSKTEDPADDALLWIGDPQHGVSASVTKVGSVWSMKYLPSEYLAWQYLKSLDSYDNVMCDSIKRSYENSLCFLISLRLTGDSTGRRVPTEQQMEAFSQRAQGLGTWLQSNMVLKCRGQDLAPALAIVEAGSAAQNQCNVMVVFPRTAEMFGASDLLDCVIPDPVSGGGTIGFQFRGEDIQDTPEINIPHSNTNS